MRWTLLREPATTDGTFGTLVDADTGRALCDTLEPSILADGNLALAPMPAGLYQAVLRYSPSHGYAVLGLQDVPDHHDIEVHPGNTIADTRDCVLPGDGRGQVRGSDRVVRYGVLNSRVTLDRLMGLVGVPGYQTLRDWNMVRDFLEGAPDGTGVVTLDVREFPATAS